MARHRQQHTKANPCGGTRMLSDLIAKPRRESNLPQVLGKD